MSGADGPPARIGIIGPGNIAGQYVRTLRDHPEVEVTTLSGRDPERAAVEAGRHGVSGSGSIERLLGDDSIDLIVNLTPPDAHVDVSLAILDAGKHVWSEKPIALDRDGVDAIARLAAARERRVGVAPDTFLGPGVGGGVRIARTGRVGALTGAVAMMQKPGPESWHPDPAFLYRRGAGPLHDMGVYYVTALVPFLGAVESVVGSARMPRRARVVATGPKAGETFEAEVPTAVRAVLSFAGGAEAVAYFSFDASVSRAVLRIEGERGEISLPDPDTFGGVIGVHSDDRWEQIAAPAGRAGRGIGIIDLLRSERAGVPHRASLELAAHVLEVMDAVLESARTGRRVLVSTRPPEHRPGILGSD